MLHRFELSPTALKFYADELVEALTSHGQVDGAMETQAYFSPLQYEEEGIECGMLLSILLPDEQELIGLLYGQSIMPEEFSTLPLLLTRGPKEAWQPVLQWLQAKFDCCVAPLRLAPHSLASLAAEWALMIRGRPLELHFELPKDIDGMRSIMVSIPDDGIARLQEGLSQKEVEQAELKRDSGQPALLAALEEHFFTHFKIRLSGASLARLGCSVAMVTREGRIKIHSRNDARKVLDTLSQLALSAA